MKILITPTSFKPDSPSPALGELRAFCQNLVFNPAGRPLTEEELIPLLEGCDGCIAGLDFFSRRVIEASGSLRVISRYGAGVDRVDLAAARDRHIAVCNTPGVNAQAVADLTFGLILAAARRIPLLDRTTREGGWIRSTGVELYGKTIGILGLGAVGKGVAKRAQGFSMRVLAYDPYIDRAYTEKQGILVSDFETIIREADVVSLHLPLMAETRGIISAGVLGRMKPGAILINTARGGLIDEAAAAAALKSGRLGGIGLDAHEEEPLRNSPFAAFDNAVLTPHTASHTVEATAAMAMLSVRNLIAVLSGKDCPYMV